MRHILSLLLLAGVAAACKTAPVVVTSAPPQSLSTVDPGPAERDHSIAKNLAEEFLAHQNSKSRYSKTAISVFGPLPGSGAYDVSFAAIDPSSQKTVVVRVDIGNRVCTLIGER